MLNFYLNFFTYLIFFISAARLPAPVACLLPYFRFSFCEHCVSIAHFRIKFVSVWFGWAFFVFLLIFPIAPIKWNGIRCVYFSIFLFLAVFWNRSALFLPIVYTFHKMCRNNALSTCDRMMLLLVVLVVWLRAHLLESIHQQLMLLDKWVFKRLTKLLAYLYSLWVKRARARNRFLIDANWKRERERNRKTFGRDSARPEFYIWRILQ